MIDWINVAFNALWIVGLSVALAALSYASWEAGMLREKMAVRLRRPAYQVALAAAGLLFCLGLAGTADALWKSLLWLALAAGFVYMGATARRQAG
jgi:hypothetical protein